MSIFIYPFQFKQFGGKSRIDNPLLIEGKENIEIANDVFIKSGGWLACLPLCGNPSPTLSIANGCRIGHFCHIYATNRIEIQSSVLLADKIYITDNSHSYNNIEIPILAQPIKQLAPVIIGEGSWIGEHVSILGASIGKHCVIGANSVVTKDIPDYSIAVGVPAKVIKRYDSSMKTWIKC